MSQIPAARQIPAGAVHMSGWAALRNESWIASVPDMDLDLLLSRSEMDFLRECATAQLSCWTTGLVFMTRHARMMVPQEIMVYFLSNDATSPMPSATLGRMLADNINYWALHHTWSNLFCSVGARNGPCRSLHPLTQLQLPAAHRGDSQWELCLGYVYTLHVQAQISSGSYRFWGGSTCPLGCSDYRYDYCTETCARSDGASRGVACTPQGCIIMAQRAPALISAARGCCIAPVKNNEQILLVAPKEALPAMQAMLVGIDVHFVLSRQDAQYALTHRVVLVTAQLLKALPTITQASWERVILFDWHRIWIHLSKYYRTPTGFFLRRNTQVVLMLADEYSGSRRSPPHSLDELGAALGVHPFSLGAAAETKDRSEERGEGAVDLALHHLRLAHLLQYRLEDYVRLALRQHSMGMVITPRVEVLLLDRARLVGVDDVSLFSIVTLGTCGRDGSWQRDQTADPDAIKVHTCGDCDTGSTLSVGGGVFMTGVVTSCVCDIEGRQVRVSVMSGTRRGYQTLGEHT